MGRPSGLHGSSSCIVTTRSRTRRPLSPDSTSSSDRSAAELPVDALLQLDTREQRDQLESARSLQVCAMAPQAHARAELLAAQLGAEPCASLPTDRMCLAVFADRVVLHVPGFAQPFALDPASVEVRRRAAAGRRLELLRACGLPLADKRVLDATAGLGRDAFVLAQAGARVDMIEREPLLQVLLADALVRQAAPARLSLHKADARDGLGDVFAGHDVIYLDPMFERATSALPQREAQLLARIAALRDARDLADAAPEREAEGLLRIALALAPPRVVVKRARTQLPLLAEPHPSHHIVGRRVRFDVYLGD